MDLIGGKGISIVNNYKYKIYLNNDHIRRKYAIKKGMGGLEKNHFF